MALIIFSKTQRVSPERFGVSVVAGSVVLLLLGALHGWLHHMGHELPPGFSLDWPTVLAAVGFGTILAVVYCSQSWFIDGVESDDRTPAPTLGEAATGSIANAQTLLTYIVIGNILLLAIGLFKFVWVPVQSGFDMITAMGAIALAAVVFLMPINFVARLRLEAWLDDATRLSREFIWQRYETILYWVLVAYWACIFASYVILLIHSPAYCGHLGLCAR